MSGFPINPPRAPVVDAQGNCTPEWYRYFAAVQRIIGGPSDPFDDNLLLAYVPPVDPRRDDLTETAPPAAPVVAQDDVAPPAIDHAPLIARVEALEAAPPPAPYIPPTGWAVYNHGGGALALTGGVRTQLVIDGATKIETEMPPGMGSLWDTSTNAIRGRLGDGIVVKVSFAFTPSSGVANEMLVEVDVGGGVGVVEIQTFATNKGSGVAHYLSWTFTAYTLDTWVANGGKIYVTANGPGSLTIPVVLIQHTHRGQP